MMLLRLFWEFFKIGLFAVGGGMATIPFLYDLSDRTGWFTYTQLADMIAISESTPGPIGVNMATYVGYEMSGVLGSISTTLGFVAPSIIIIVIVSIFLQKFRDNRYVESAFYGLRPASSGLIASAALSVAIVALLADGWSFGTLWQSIRWPAVVLAAFLAIVTNLSRPKSGTPLCSWAFPLWWVLCSTLRGCKKAIAEGILSGGRQENVAALLYIGKSFRRPRGWGAAPPAAGGRHGLCPCVSAEPKRAAPSSRGLQVTLQAGKTKSSPSYPLGAKTAGLYFLSRARRAAYLRRVASPPRRWRSSLLRSSTTRTSRYSG